MTAYYLAAQWARREEMRGYRDQIVKLGHAVTSSWLDVVTDSADGMAPTPDGKTHYQHAQQDLADIDACDRFVLFTETPNAPKGTGGRFVELGYALGIAMGEGFCDVVIIGPIENLFCYLPSARFDSWETFAATVKRQIGPADMGVIR